MHIGRKEQVVPSARCVLGATPAFPAIPVFPDSLDNPDIPAFSSPYWGESEGALSSP